jgi:predicted porin
MKRIIVTCACFVSIPAAHAQSSVTLYGIIDEGFEAISNAPVAGSKSGGRLFRLDANNGLNGSRWGLKGSEDLGGGLKAIFTLENGFELNTGNLAQGGSEFGRQAFVGLSSDRYGAVTLGRQYDPIIDYVGIYEFGDTNLGSDHSAHPGDLDNFNFTRRQNNSVKYQSPSYGGLNFEGLYSFGGVPGSLATNQAYSFGAHFVRGPLGVSVAYSHVNNPAASLFGSNPTDTATSNGLTASPIYSGYASARLYQVVAAGGSYKFEHVIVGATYSNIRYSNITALSGSSADFNDAEVSLQYLIAPDWSVGAAYNFLKGSAVTQTVGGAKYNQISAGVNHSLSKRTDVYLSGAWQTVSGNDSTGHAAVANIADLPPSSNHHQAVARVGIRHKF